LGVNRYRLAESIVRLCMQWSLVHYKNKAKF